MYAKTASLGVEHFAVIQRMMRRPAAVRLDLDSWGPMELDLSERLRPSTHRFYILGLRPIQQERVCRLGRLPEAGEVADQPEAPGECSAVSFGEVLHAGKKQEPGARRC